MRRVFEALFLFGALVACDRPSVLVMCHNANCVGPPDPSRDDTLETLTASLALEYRGRPAIDGMELDVFWHGAANDGSGRCTFAHDGETAPQAPAATVAARVIAEHLEQPGEIAHNGERFYIRLELKGAVGDLGDEHSDEQATQHSECALDLLDIFTAAAQAGDRWIVVIFDSPAPLLLERLVSRPRWPGKNVGSQVELRLSADFVDSTPSGFALQYLGDFPSDIDDVVFHADWIRDGHYQAFRSMDLDLTLWMFSVTTETLDALGRLQPDAVLTSEALLMRRWLEY